MPAKAAAPAPAPAAAAPATPAPKADAKADPKAAPPAPADAKAQATPPPADPNKAAAADPQKEAAKKLDEGLKAQKAGQHDKAIEALAAAFKLKESPEAALALARSEMALGKHRDAAQHLSYFLREGQSAKPEDKQAAEKMFAEAKAKVGSLIVTVDAEGAEVLVDGAAVGVAPLGGPIFVEPGARLIEARKEGMAPAKKPMEVAAGTEGSVELTLAAPPPPPPPVAPPPPPPAPAGPNKIILYAGVGLAGGLALVSLGTVIGSAVVDSSSYDKWESDKCTRTNAQCLADFDDAQGTSAALGNTAFWTLIGAVAVGGGTAAYWFLGNKAQKTAPSAALVPTPGGVMVKGSF